MSIIACDSNDLDSVYQPLAAILKNGCYGPQGANLRWPNIHFFPNMFINTSAKFGACITKRTIGLIC